jgi:hypothetical protein
VGRRPCAALLAAGAAGHPLLPIQRNAGDVTALVGPLLPVLMGRHGFHQVDARLTASQGIGVRVAGVDQMLGRQYRPGCRGLVDGLESAIIRPRGDAGMHVGDDVRPFLVAALGQMDRGADPFRAALVPVARVDIVGAVDDLPGGNASLARRRIGIGTGTAWYGCSQTVRKVCTVGNARSHNGLSAASRASNRARPSAPICSAGA